tara:strand:- start:7458 stop:8588 length:1131 start_codon:yes stop_codon:yes gene_type:complete
VRARITLTWKRLIFGISTLAVLGCVTALIIAWSGIYSIAASKGHPAWLNVFLEFGMRRSVEANARKLDTPDLSDSGLIVLGAAHYFNGCAPCHGGPGDPVDPVFDGMLPSPPPLEEDAGNWKDHELHWIIYNGLQYAGMPQWPGWGREDEVWPLAAYLRVAPELDAESYLALASGNASISEQTAEDLVEAGRSRVSRETCAKCHETDNDPPVSDVLPRLAGQSEAYLYRALSEYFLRQRESGFMEPVAAELDEAEISALASYYSGLSASSATQAQEEPGSVFLGRQIALQGLPGKDIPACASCHGSSRRADFPMIKGQSARYIRQQLKLWKSGGRQSTDQARLMAGIATALSDEEIDAVASWLGSEPGRQLEPVTR